MIRKCLNKVYDRFQNVFEFSAFNPIDCTIEVRAQFTLILLKDLKSLLLECGFQLRPQSYYLILLLVCKFLGYSGRHEVFLHDLVPFVDAVNQHTAAGSSGKPEQSEHINATERLLYLVALLVVLQFQFSPFFTAFLQHIKFRVVGLPKFSVFFQCFIRLPSLVVDPAKIGEYVN